ncbi:MAG: Gfo/Idh/MocA family protein, partial [Butyricicoccus sp.]
MSKKVKIGVLGAGRIGRLHITNLVQSVPAAEVVAIADPFLNDDTIAFAQSLGIQNCSKDPQDIFANPEIEAVSVCTPNNVHPTIAIDALRAGKNVLCEKPAARTYAEALEMQKV